MVVNLTSLQIKGCIGKQGLAVHTLRLEVGVLWFGWSDGWMDGWMDGCSSSHLPNNQWVDLIQKQFIQPCLRL